METKATTFDAIAMTRQAALRLHETLAPMTPEEELAFWRERTRELRERRAKPLRQRS